MYEECLNMLNKYEDNVELSENQQERLLEIKNKVSKLKDKKIKFECREGR